MKDALSTAKYAEHKLDEAIRQGEPDETINYWRGYRDCAVRYALGRMSYMPGLVMDVIRPMIKDCSGKTLWCFEKDISELLFSGKHEIDAYEKGWGEFLLAVRAEIEKRK